MNNARHGAATPEFKLWLACGFAVLGLGAVAWSAWPSISKPKPKSDRPELVSVEPTDDAGNLVETNYRPTRSSSQQQAVIEALGTSVQTLAAAFPSRQLAGEPEELASSTQAVLSMMLDPSEESLEQMFVEMGGSLEPDEDDPEEERTANQSMLVKFIKGMFGQGELDLDRMVVRPKPDDEGMGGSAGPQRVARNAETRERIAASDGPGENRRVAKIRMTDPFPGAEELAKKQRPVEVRVPYRQKGEDGERILALDLLYNPAVRKWQMVEMRFEQVMQESGG